MQRCKWMTMAIGAAGISCMAMSAQAAPFKPTTEAASLSVDRIARRCWLQNGVRYCDRSSKATGSDYRVRNIPEAYPTGSQYWWEEMDRQNRGGRGGRN